jgi:hypothetical protein
MKRKRKIIYLITVINILNFLSCSTSTNPGSKSTGSNDMDSTKAWGNPAMEKVLAPSAKKYDIKSGIITFENIQQVSGVNIFRGKDIIYFDDYGMKECKETYNNGELTESFLSDGKKLVRLIHENETAFNAGLSNHGTENRFDWNEVEQNNMDTIKLKKLPNETIAGKDCEVFSQIVNGLTMKYGGWNHIYLLNESDFKDRSRITRAVKIEENVTVPADKFIVPNGYKFQ